MARAFTSWGGADRAAPALGAPAAEAIPSLPLITQDETRHPLTDDPAARQYHVHLIAYAPAPTSTPPKNRPYILPGLIEDPPMYRARIHLEDRPRNVRAGNKDARIEVHGDTVEIQANDIPELVTIEY